MYLELHMVQSFAPANLNRDDTNNPKDCEFGGVRRARISSQCIKRAMRTCPQFAETTKVPNGMRSRYIARRLRERLLEAGRDAEQIAAVLGVFVPSLLSRLDAKDPGQTLVLIYLSEGELAAIQSALEEQWDALLQEPKAAKTAADKMTRDLEKAFRSHSGAPDIALFGRMLAENPDLNLDAACQVAHAISTHRVSMEMDFFTAVDDLQPSEETGAAMMGIVGYNSSCFYRYARIDWEQLLANLDGAVELAQRTVEGFLRAAVVAVPSGKQNSFAAQNPPSLVMAVVREDGMSWSLANAFERPVRADREGGYVRASCTALDAYWHGLETTYGAETLTCVSLLTPEQDLPLEHLGDRLAPNLTSWIETVVGALPGRES